MSLLHESYPILSAFPDSMEIQNYFNDLLRTHLMGTNEKELSVVQLFCLMNQMHPQNDVEIYETDNGYIINYEMKSEEYTQNIQDFVEVIARICVNWKATCNISYSQVFKKHRLQFYILTEKFIPRMTGEHHFDYSKDISPVNPFFAKRKLVKDDRICSFFIEKSFDNEVPPLIIYNSESRSSNKPKYLISYLIGSVLRDNLKEQKKQLEANYLEIKDRKQGQKEDLERILDWLDALDELV